MASVIYNKFKADIFGTLNLSADTIKVALVTSGYTPDIDAHDYFDDITNEVTGTGYTAGGETLASKTLTQDNTDDEGVFDAGDTTWSSSSMTAYGAVIYKSTGTAATSPLIAYIDFTENKTSQLGDFQITWATEGIINLG